MFNVARKEIKFKESSKKFGMKFRDGCTAVVSPGVGVWGVGEFPGFQGASKGFPSRSTNLLSVPRPDIRPHSLNCLTFFVETRAGRGGGWYLDLLGKKYDNVARARDILLGWEEI